MIFYVIKVVHRATEIVLEKQHLWAFSPLLRVSTTMKQPVCVFLVIFTSCASVGLAQTDKCAQRLCQGRLGEERGDTRGSAARSCQQVAELRPGSVSGYYWVQSLNGSLAQQVYCFNNRERRFGQEGGWMRVANVDMKHGDSECPSGFQHVVESKMHLCNKTVSVGCSSAYFPTHGLQYSKVCGRIIGYQWGSPDAFCPSYASCTFIQNPPSTVTIDDVYADGISITHGTAPRKHIWTLPAGYSSNSNSYYTCPCTNPTSYPGIEPSFIRNDYYCESGNPDDVWQTQLYAGDPLWDGLGCTTESSTCCDGDIRPYFCKELPAPTTDDIEVRLCLDEGPSNENVLVEVIELYVQ